MPGHQLVDVLRRLGPSAFAREGTDADLLARYAQGRDEVAFEALVRRHGPMVLGVCRRVLGGDADAEDAFQATFLVLARKAVAVRDQAALNNWLYGVAHNVARRARAMNRRRRALERSLEPSRLISERSEGSELGLLIDDELSRLPEKYRIPIVSCGLEGKTIREVAVELGWPAGTVATRLARGRDLFARRLARRGIAVPLLGAATNLARATPTDALVEITVRNVATAGPIPTVVLTLTHEVMYAMLFNQWKLGLAVLLTVGLGFGVVVTQSVRVAATQPTSAVVAEADAPQADPTAARKLLDQLRELKPTNGGEALQDYTAAILRDFIRLDAEAVPDLIAELDATTDPFLLRCLGFAARAIGDKRVIPALIRALPKTCLPPTSDYGVVVKDPALLAFLQKHDSDKLDGGRSFSFGRPISEFRSALQKLTGTTHGEDELSNVFLGGTVEQQALQRALYSKCAERWSAWWEQHAKEFVADPKFAHVALPKVLTGLSAGFQFPHGPKVKVTSQTANCQLESSQNPNAKQVFVDLDTGRCGSLPERLRSAPGKPDRVDDIAAWAATEGYDLMGTEYTPVNGGKPHYVLRGLGLTAWQIDLKRWDKLEAELTSDRPFPLGIPTGGLLARFDAKTGQYVAEETVQFLFRTRENGFGWLFVGVEVHDDSLQPGGVAAPGLELNPVGFSKGRRYAYSLVGVEAPTERK